MKDLEKNEKRISLLDVSLTDAQCIQSFKNFKQLPSSGVKFGNDNSPKWSKSNSMDYYKGLEHGLELMCAISKTDIGKDTFTNLCSELRYDVLKIIVEKIGN